MKIKQYYPFVVPTISLLLVLFLAIRWYSLRTQRDLSDDITQVEIENLTQDELMIVQGAQDVNKVDLQGDGELPISGQIRYKIDNNRILLTVTAELEDIKEGNYQVWLSSEKKSPQKAFLLEKTKSGYVGSASVSIEQLPLEVIITDQTGKSDTEMGKELLRGEVMAKEQDLED